VQFGVIFGILADFLVESLDFDCPIAMNVKQKVEVCED
jgi:hypothetical protein